jgi:hypothetical protein
MRPACSRHGKILSASLINYSVCMLPLDPIVLGFRERNVFLSFANGLGPHEVLEARRGKDERQVDDVSSDVGDRNQRIGRDEHGRATVHLSHGASQMHPSGSGLEKIISHLRGVLVTE